MGPAQANVRNYYMMFEQNQTQGLIDNKLVDFESKSRDNFQAQVTLQPLPASEQATGSPLRHCAPSNNPLPAQLRMPCGSSLCCLCPLVALLVQCCVLQVILAACSHRQCGC